MSGGGTSLSKKEREKIYEEVDAEFDADERVSKKKKGGKSKKRITSDVDELGLLFGGGLTGKRPRYANKITIKVYITRNGLICLNCLISSCLCPA